MLDRNIASCLCINGYSGELCEITTSLSGFDTLAMSKVNSVQAVGDSGNDGTNGYANVIDDDISTSWVFDGDSDKYIEFDMQIAVKTVAFAVKHSAAHWSATRHWPKDMKLEVSNTGHTVPWSLAKEFQLVATDRWQLFDIPILRSSRDFSHGSCAS